MSSVTPRHSPGFCSCGYGTYGKCMMSLFYAEGSACTNAGTTCGHAINADGSFTVSQSGTVYFKVADTSYGDNWGTLSVTIAPATVTHQFDLAATEATGHALTLNAGSYVATVTGTYQTCSCGNPYGGNNPCDHVLSDAQAFTGLCSCGYGTYGKCMMSLFYAEGSACTNAGTTCGHAINADGSFTVSQSGTVYFKVADTSYGDNWGTLSVTIAPATAPEPPPVEPAAPPVAPVDQFQWYSGPTSDFNDATAVGNVSPTNTIVVGSGDVDTYFFVKVSPAEGGPDVIAKAFFISGAYGCSDGAAAETFGKKSARRR
eukprot:TRINITY_DN10591_c2_g2_i3.p1 TRINITY_DN10591_c2_g2~~TRINITY_DN10591_c2_g2_i3.p1  ORF type:complete len:316 (+),score=70.99 TRINITY_DN10591_c2_g2_i3:222-1169(+)